MKESGIIRALTSDHAFRVVAVQTTAVVRGIVLAQRASGTLASSLGQLVTGTLLVRETMAPAYRVQGIVRARHGGTALVADSHPSGDLRGLVQIGGKSEMLEPSSGTATLQVMRTLASGSLQQGLVEFPAGGGISEALMAYMQTSEQVTSVVSVGTAFSDSEVIGAGGYMVQLLPEAQRESLRQMIDQLEGFGKLEARLLEPDFDARGLLDALLAGIPYSVLGSDSVRYHCWCNEVRVMSALATLKRADLEELLVGGEPLSLSCDYCRKDYQIQPAQLRGLLEQS
jgi:molecular chaperone Hsp33